MVRRYIEKRSGADPEKRWSEFGNFFLRRDCRADCKKSDLRAPEALVAVKSCSEKLMVEKTLRFS